MRGPEFMMPDWPCPDDPSPRDVAVAFLHYFATQPRTMEHFWAFELVSELVDDRHDEAWAVILALLDISESDEHLAIIAAGPLEDLLCTHGPLVITRVEAMAMANSRFRRCLRGVWGFNRMDASVRKTVDALVRNEPPL